MAQDNNSGFTLPTQPESVASNAVDAVSNIASQVSQEILPVAATSTRDILIAGAILILLIVIFYFIKEYMVNNLINKRISPNYARASGWWLFLTLILIAIFIILSIMNFNYFFSFLYTIPFSILIVISIVMIFVSRKK